MVNYLFEGTIIHYPKRLELCILENAFLYIEDSKVKYFGQRKPDNIIASNIEYCKLSKDQFLIPGFIDTHIHAPQYPNIGLGYDVELMEWLDNYTYKTEIQFNDQEYAKRIYSYVVNRTLINGTTTASYYGTTNLKSSIILADIAIERGQRALIGLVNMSENGPPELLRTNDESIEETETFIKTILSKNNKFVQPIITPRFAISCNEDLLKRLGDLVEKYHVNVQTHISENKKEIEATLEMYPGYKNYADIYDKANLLTTKTILAHAIHLTDEEKDTLIKRGTSISHCPSSNLCLHSGLCNVRDLLNRGINVGLGTDVSGGCSPSILDAAKSAVNTSNSVAFTEPADYETIDYADALYLATLGGAEALKIDDRVGNFNVGKEFDALLVNLSSPNCPVDLMQDYTVSELLQKFMYLGDDRNIEKVFVGGRCVVDKTSATK